MLSSIIRTKIIPSQRCSNISELFNSSVLEYNYLRRVKLYHLACQKQIQLKCFYDKIFMCLCNTDRFANCFQFNHSMTYDCHITRNISEKSHTREKEKKENKHIYIYVFMPRG
jgi:hypothetical protein